MEEDMDIYHSKTIIPSVTDHLKRTLRCGQIWNHMTDLMGSICPKSSYSFAMLQGLHCFIVLWLKFFTLHFKHPHAGLHFSFSFNVYKIVVPLYLASSVKWDLFVILCIIAISHDDVLFLVFFYCFWVKCLLFKCWSTCAEHHLHNMAAFAGFSASLTTIIASLAVSSAASLIPSIMFCSPTTNLFCIYMSETALYESVYFLHVSLPYMRVLPLYFLVCIVCNILFYSSA